MNCIVFSFILNYLIFILKLQISSVFCIFFMWSLQQIKELKIKFCTTFYSDCMWSLQQICKICQIKHLKIKCCTTFYSDGMWSLQQIYRLKKKTFENIMLYNILFRLHGFYASYFVLLYDFFFLKIWKTKSPDILKLFLCRLENICVTFVVSDVGSGSSVGIPLGLSGA